MIVDQIMELVSIDSASKHTEQEAADYLLRCVPSLGEHPEILRLTKKQWAEVDAAMSDGVSKVSARYKKLVNVDVTKVELSVALVECRKSIEKKSG